MRIEVHILVWRRQHYKYSWGPILSDTAFFNLFAFAIEQQLTYDQMQLDDGFFRIRCAPQHEGLAVLFKMLEREGWKPHYGYVQAGSTERFRVRLVRRYDPEDYEQASLFYTSGFQGILSFGKHDGLHEYGWTSDGIDLGNEDDGPTEEPRVASLGPYNYFVRSDLKEELLASGLVGLSFRPLHWSAPERPVDDYWEIRCTRTMPSCLLTYIFMDGHPHYEEDGYDPVELQFRQTEVEKLGVFDVAWTAEDLDARPHPNWGKHTLVFSRKFRQTLRRLAVKETAMNVGIVRLVA